MAQMSQNTISKGHSPISILEYMKCEQYGEFHE